MNKKILIIGGTGFIGYHLAKKCLKLKWKVTSLSSKKPTKIRVLKKVSYLICDISSYNNLKKTLKKKNFDYIVNLGGYINHYDKKAVHNSHFLGVKNLVKLFLQKGVSFFVQIGSSAEYGTVSSPHNEKSRCIYEVSQRFRRRRETAVENISAADPSSSSSSSFFQLLYWLLRNN